METLTLYDVREMAIEAKDELYRLNDDEPPKIYLHWTAGHYWTPFSDYHINILGNGEIMSDCDGLDEVLAHTYMRNTGSIGIALCCAYEATTNDLGDEPPTDTQIDTMAHVIAILCEALEIPCDKEHVMTHGEAADNEDGEDMHEAYGPKSTVERWDLEYLGTEDSPEYNPYATDESRGGDILRYRACQYLREV